MVSPKAACDCCLSQAPLPGLIETGGSLVIASASADHSSSELDGLVEVEQGVPPGGSA